jgi:hypothetical protein
MGVSAEDYGTDFELNSADKEPFQQITFMLADEQAEFIKEQVTIAGRDNNILTFGNENGNGNALFRMVTEWSEQRT